MFLILNYKRNMHCLHLVERKEQTCTWTMITASLSFTCDDTAEQHSHTHTGTHTYLTHVQGNMEFDSFNC